MVIALWLAGCAPETGTTTDTGRDTGVDTAIVDTAIVDTGDTGSETGDTSDTGGETGVDTSDTAIDTSDTAVDTADTALDTAVDTADTGTATPTDYTTAAGGTMIYLTGGTYSMGSGLGDSGAAYVDHDVTLSHDFYLAQTETTRAEWETNPANASWAYSSLTTYPCTGMAADCPADTMTWYDAAMYANWLSVVEGLTECYLADGTDMAAAYVGDPYSCPGYRLPTEAEWEYAARAGVDTTYAGSSTAADVAWTYLNAYAVGTYARAACALAANAWGFCDLSGNVWEWTNDWYESGYGGYASGAAEADPPGPSSGSYRVLRGGDWYSYASYATVACRDSTPPTSAGTNAGFRLARSIP